jgi:hypothetical protein
MPVDTASPIFFLCFSSVRGSLASLFLLSSFSLFHLFDFLFQCHVPSLIALSNFNDFSCTRKTSSRSCFNTVSSDCFHFDMPQILILYNFFAFASTSLHFSLAIVLDCFHGSTMNLVFLLFYISIVTSILWLCFSSKFHYCLH